MKIKKSTKLSRGRGLPGHDGHRRPVRLRRLRQQRNRC